MKAFKTLAITIMIIGTIGLALNIIFGTNTVSYLSSFYVNGIKYYKYDFASYLKNISTNLQAVTELELELPSRTWQTGEWSAVINDLALILDYVIFGLNIILYPMRLGGYITINAWALLGINPDATSYSPIYWIIKLARFLQETQIPYI